MTQYHGKNLYFSFDASPGGGLQDLSAHVVSVDFPRSVDTADVSTAGDSDHDYLAGLRNATMTINFVWDDGATGPDAIMTAHLGASQTGSYEFGPSGNTGGLVKYSGEGLVTNFSVSSGISDAVKATATIQCSGAVTRGTF